VILPEHPAVARPVPDNLRTGIDRPGLSEPRINRS
jgi:hypothetical protein